MDTTNNACRLCGKRCDSGFAKSHIIPWGFFKRGKHKNDMSLISDDGASKRLRQGVYDDHLLCDECEHRYFHAPDTYGIMIYRDLQGATCRDLSNVDRQCQYYAFADVDRRQLRAFFASVLWRCSVSRRDEWKRICIGASYERRIARDILESGEFDYIDALGIHFNAKGQDKIVQELNGGCKFPERSKRICWNGHVANGYNFFLPGYKFVISLDQRKHPFACCWDEHPVATKYYADISPSVSKAYDGKELMLYEGEYPDFMVEQIRNVCKCARPGRMVKRIGADTGDGAREEEKIDFRYLA